MTLSTERLYKWLDALGSIQIVMVGLSRARHSALRWCGEMVQRQASETLEVRDYSGETTAGVALFSSATG
jgi:hypothetical protein